MFDSERKPRRQDRWDKVHLRTVSTHLREEEDALFRVACSLERTTRYAVMQALARGWLESWWKENGGGRRDAGRGRKPSANGKSVAAANRAALRPPIVPRGARVEMNGPNGPPLRSRAAPGPPQMAAERSAAHDRRENQQRNQEGGIPEGRLPLRPLR